jgi:hypothetical protein
VASYITSHIVTGILECDSQTKQKLGIRMATHLHLEGGNLGPDDGIDGFATFAEHRLMFQCKLYKNERLGPDHAKIFWADLVRHRMTAGIYLAGFGYTDGFRIVSKQMDEAMRDLGRPISCFLLTLADIFDKTEVLREATCLLPPIASLDQAVVV